MKKLLFIFLVSCGTYNPGLLWQEYEYFDVYVKQAPGKVYLTFRSKVPEQSVPVNYTLKVSDKETGHIYYDDEYITVQPNKDVHNTHFINPIVRHYHVEIIDVKSAYKKRILI